MDDRVMLAARNNALWCDAVCRTHGLRTTLDDSLWSSATRTPPYYPDAVTLAPTVSEYDVLARVDANDGCSVKDSFSTLDLTMEDFARLVVGQWVWLDGDTDAATRSEGRLWSSVSSPAELGQWQRAWSRGEDDAAIFRSSLLTEAGIHFLAAREPGDGPDGPVVAGAILSVTGAVAGVSNLFDINGDETRTWREVAARAHSLTGGLPLVGWDAGDSLERALAAGCTALGPLTVWIR
ncbi:hypothetical protein N865_16920 [Intrasporangium oryzae NRRL B-24470]|uniref:GCN5 family acetyltransferase n=1 Tax=Intrasporangium oryzae NRRL B-24470 TaxID=1386089 RepID=W9GHQ0_9MICO|nr:hypothetical protein [Intrasporangium oryzae]EWT03414.1 hypothetical protein N865_16920 [Intrasporangium oryzae NRRL B-24470]